MKINLLRMLGRAALVVCTVFALNACGDDEPDSPDIDPDDPSQVDPETPVSDPVGTVTVNIANDDKKISLYNGIQYNMTVSIDAANNFSAGHNYSGGDICEIVSVGKVAGLGNITEIPTAGWKKKAAVTPGEGYVIRMKDMDFVNGNWINFTSYGRIYVVEYMESVSGGIMGARVKYQAPFELAD